MVVQLCHLRLFRSPLFPRACLRQALTLYAVLTRLGYPMQVHFGVQKAGENLHGHSWVTVQGTPVAEQTQTELFPIVYSYPLGACHAPQDTCERFSHDGHSDC
jgi:Transglutaminase-like superfamily